MKNKTYFFKGGSMYKKFLLSLISLVAFQGCATNPFSKHYHDVTEGADLSKLSYIVQSTGEPKIIQGFDRDADSLKMVENNYGLIGYSSFNGPVVDKSLAVNHAKKVKASTVIFYSNYTGSVSGSMPLVLPDTKISTTSLSGSAYGTGGSSSYSGTARTTTYGTQTTYIPYTVHRADHFATYWVKKKLPVLGVQLIDLDAEQKSEIKSNKGMQVFAVVKGSPAFEADILQGDILLKIGDFSIYDRDIYQKALSQHQGKEVDVVIYRDKQEKIIPVKLNLSY